MSFLVFLSLLGGSVNFFFMYCFSDPSYWALVYLYVRSICNLICQVMRIITCDTEISTIHTSKCAYVVLAGLSTLTILCNTSPKAPTSDPNSIGSIEWYTMTSSTLFHSIIDTYQHRIVPAYDEMNHRQVHTAKGIKLKDRTQLC